MRCSADPRAIAPHRRGRVLAAALAMVTLTAVAPPATAASANHRCVGGEEARAAGEDGGAPTFPAALRHQTLTLTVSLDGLDGPRVPMAIETVCGMPAALKHAAAQLAGADAVALLSAWTTVVADGEALQGPAALVPLAEADTARVWGRMTPPSMWQDDEDGDAIPTFIAGRITVTD
jgi:hypothetical protein